MVEAIMRWALLLAVVVAARRDSEERNVRRRGDGEEDGTKKGRQWRLSGGFEYHPGDPVAVVANKVNVMDYYRFRFFLFTGT